MSSCRSPRKRLCELGEDRGQPMSVRTAVAAVVALVSTLLVIPPGVASASSGASSTCSSGRVCLSNDWHSPGSTTTTMTHGYYFWNESGYKNLYGRYFSNGGGAVVERVESVRNRDLNHRDACYYNWDEHVQARVFYVRNTYSYVGWTNLGSPQKVDFYRAC